jgi:general secretion pathway protein A
VVPASDERFDGLPVSRTSPHDLIVTLHRFLDSIASLGTTSAIVIDDAQHLQRRALEQLRALSNLESEAGKLLQIVLVGEPQLTALLRRPEAYQLGDRVGSRINLEPLSRTEIGLYIDFRLRVARAGETRPGRVQFSASAVRMLARVSRGIPRVLNALCDRSLEIGCERRAERITRGIVSQSARQLRLPIPLSVRYPVARDVAAALVAAALVAVPLIRLGKSMQAPLLAFVSQRRAATTGPATAAPDPVPTPILAAKKAEPVGAAPSNPLKAADSYLVVVASFKSAHSAGAIAAELEGFGLPAFARDGQTAGWHVVLVGPYASAEEAQEARRQVAGHNFPDSRVQVQRH